MRSCMSKRKVWWILIDRRGRVVCDFESKDELTVHSTRKAAEREAKCMRKQEGIEVTPQKIEIVSTLERGI